jgi:mannose-6-phosphate isomerase-like protein (cupin superfamily)
VKVVQIDEIAPASPEGVEWRPLRAELGISAFGVGVYRANAGEEVVPRHAETGGGAGKHEELYVVVSGRATFTVEDETFDAPTGTCVFAVPGERREARAEEAGTTVLAVGGPAGEAFRVAPWEYGARAARAAELRDVDELERVADEGIAAYGEHVTMLYARACVAAQRGRREEALQYLDRAAHDEDFGDWVRENAPSEPLLEPIRDDPAFPRAAR